MKTKDLIAEAISLPVEERAIVVESILSSLNPPDPSNATKWISTAKKRLHELRSGSAQPIPGDEVFNRLLGEFSS